MAKWVKAIAPVNSCSTPISHNHCSTVGVVVGSNPTPSIALNMLLVIIPRARSNHLSSSNINAKNLM